MTLIKTRPMCAHSFCNTLFIAALWQVIDLVQLTKHLALFPFDINKRLICCEKSAKKNMCLTNVKVQVNVKSESFICVCVILKQWIYVETIRKFMWILIKSFCERFKFLGNRNLVKMGYIVKVVAFRLDLPLYF
jgi:hypothetical protein